MLASFPKEKGLHTVFVDGERGAAASSQGGALLLPYSNSILSPPSLTVHRSSKID